MDPNIWIIILVLIAIAAVIYFISKRGKPVTPYWPDEKPIDPTKPKPKDPVGGDGPGKDR